MDNPEVDNPALDNPVYTNNDSTNIKSTNIKSTNNKSSSSLKEVKKRVKKNDDDEKIFEIIQSGDNCYSEFGNKWEQKSGEVYLFLNNLCFNCFSRYISLLLRIFNYPFNRLMCFLR